MIHQPNEAVKTIETWLGRNNDESVDPCQPSCAFMMDYQTLEAIRTLVDAQKTPPPEPVTEERVWNLDMIFESYRNTENWDGLEKALLALPEKKPDQDLFEVCATCGCYWKNHHAESQKCLTQDSVFTRKKRAGFDKWCCLICGEFEATKGLDSAKCPKCKNEYFRSY